MFRYILSYGEYEDKWHIELLHHQQFTRNEFNLFVKTVIKKMLSLNDDKSSDQWEGMEYIGDAMITDYGFVKADEIQCSYDCGSYGNWEL